MKSYAADAWNRKLSRLLIQSNQWNFSILLQVMEAWIYDSLWNYPPNAWPDAGTNND